MESSSGEKPEGLEVVSIGTLYRGPWDKKYWSSSRGKDRYPYPVGYHALRTNAGVTYKMEIQEGIKGPLFTVTSSSGDSCSGQTPDIAWGYFQKKSGPRVKNRHGKRFSCKIDGIELFGFRNPFIQRLLRELVANVHGVAEQNLTSHSHHNDPSILERDNQEPESFTADLLVYLGNQHCVGKKSRRHRSATVKPASAVHMKRVRSQDLMHDTDFCTSEQGNGHHLQMGTLKDDIAPCGILNHDRIDSNDASLPAMNNDISYQIGAEFQNSGLCEPHKEKLDVVEGQYNSVSLVNIVPVQSRLSDCFVEENTIPGHGDSGPTGTENEFSSMDNEMHGSSDTDLESAKKLVKTQESELEKSNGATNTKDTDLYISDSLDTVQDNGVVISPVTERGTSLSNKDDCIVDEPIPRVTLPCAPELSTLDVTKVLNRGSGMNTNILDNGPLGTEVKPCITACLLGDASSEGFAKESQSADLGRYTGFKSSHMDFAEQESARSMMTLLLPRAVPLLTKSYQRKRGRKCSQEISSIDPNGANSSVNDLKCRINNLLCQGERVELLGEGAEWRIKQRETPLGTSPLLQETIVDVERSFCDDIINKPITTCENSEDVQFIVPDSFENDQSSHYLVAQMPLSTSGGETDQPPSEKKNDDLEASQVLGKSKCGPEEADCMFEACEGNNTCLLPDFNPNKDESPLNVTTSSPVDAIKDTPVLEAYGILNSNFHSSNGEVKHGEGSLHCTQQDISNVRSEKSKQLVHPNINILTTKIDEKAADIRHTACALNVDDKKVVSGNEDPCSLILTANMISSIGEPLAVSEMMQKRPFSPYSASKCKLPFSESIICRNINNGEIVETSYTDKPSCTTENKQIGVDIDINENTSYDDGDAQHVTPLNNIPESVDAQFNVSSPVSQSQEAIRHLSSDINDFKVVHTFFSDVGNNHLDPVNTNLAMAEECCNTNLPFQELQQNSPDQVKNGASTYSDEKLPAKYIASNNHNDHPHSEHYKDNLLVGPSEDMKPNEDFVGFVELIGSYLHPKPVLSILLTAKDRALHICILCGLSERGDGDLFVYKIPIAEQINCPSFLGHTSVFVPVLEDVYNRVIPVERSGIQFTPDGQSLVLLDCIKAPCCREKNNTCLCSVCKLDCCEENSVKIIHVELGYVSIVSKLKAIGRIYCILVCEPNHLLAVEESGKLHVWTMNTTWNTHMEKFILPSFDYMSPSVIELKQVPRSDCLVVGHNGVGGYCLWDISRKALLSQFSSPGNKISKVLPVGLFRIPWEDALATVIRVEDHVEEILAATAFSLFQAEKNDSTLLPTGEGTAVWLLVSATSLETLHDHHIKELDASSVGWRLALLAKDMVLMGSELDPRASCIATLSGYGITGTNDGGVYIWELTTGDKLADLPCFDGGSISCIATDSKSGAFAVASDKCELRIYIRSLMLGHVGR